MENLGLKAKLHQSKIKLRSPHLIFKNKSPYLYLTMVVR